jgi:hypothetical protein
MKAYCLIVLGIAWSGMAPAMSFWTALAEIESGGNDYAIGNVGEVSRYQIRPEVWRAYSSSRHYANPAVALPIAEKYLAKLKRDFERVTGRAATESDCVILWKSGIAGYEKKGFNPARMSAAHQDRVTRFQNLRNESLMLVRGPAQKAAPPAVVPGAPRPVDSSGVERFFLPPVGTEKAALMAFGGSNPASQSITPGTFFAGFEAPLDTAQRPTLCLR